MHPSLVTISGPSGAGKSLLIRALQSMDERFVYVSPFMTRPQRPGETDKICVPGHEIDRMERLGELVAVNRLYGATYATPRSAIETALREGRFPVVDFPIWRVPSIETRLGGSCHCIYVSPPSVDVLRQRVGEGRNSSASRLRVAVSELRGFQRGRFDGLIDLAIISAPGRESDNVIAVRISYLNAIGIRT